MRNIFLLIIIAAMFGCGTNDKKKTEEPPVANGEKLYKENCASCHKCLVDFTGPRLRGSLERWEDKALMYEFVRSPWAVIQKNDYAKKLQEKYASVMPAFVLSDKEIDAILDYCTTEDPATVPAK